MLLMLLLMLLLGADALAVAVAFAFAVAVAATHWSSRCFSKDFIISSGITCLNSAM